MDDGVLSANPPLHAWNVYPYWKKAVASARESVTIFSPYLDSALTKLLESLDPAVKPEKVHIITMKSVEVFLQNPKQLKTVKSLINSKYLVSWIPCLHAKVLIVDDKCLYFGSQNFTTQGTRNKEVSAGPVCPGQGTFMDHLKEWEKEAESIPELLIDSLLSILPTVDRKQKKLNLEAQEAFDQALRQYDDEKLRIENEATEEKKRAELAEQKRLENEKIEKKKEELRNKVQILAALSSYTQIEGTVKEAPGEDFESLLFDTGSHAITRKPGEPVDINWHEPKRLQMYPAILIDSFRMAFVRLGDGRITYVRFGVGKRKWRTSLREWEWEVSIKFPEKETFRRNIKATFFFDEDQVCEMAVLFDGADAKVVGRELSQHPTIDFWGNFAEEAELYAFKKPDEIGRFWHSCLGAFKYVPKGLGMEEKNIRDLLKDSRYELGVIEFAGIPFITLRTLW